MEVFAHLICRPPRKEYMIEELGPTSFGLGNYTCTRKDLEVAILTPVLPFSLPPFLPPFNGHGFSSPFPSPVSIRLSSAARTFGPHQYSLSPAHYHPLSSVKPLFSLYDICQGHGVEATPGREATGAHHPRAHRDLPPLRPQLENDFGMKLKCSHYVPRPSSAVSCGPVPCIVYLHGNSGSRIDADDLVPPPPLCLRRQPALQSSSHPLTPSSVGNQ